MPHSSSPDHGRSTIAVTEVYRDWWWHRFAAWITSPVPSNPWSLGAWVALWAIAVVAWVAWATRRVEWGGLVKKNSYEANR